MHPPVATTPRPSRPRHRARLAAALGASLLWLGPFDLQSTHAGPLDLPDIGSSADAVMTSGAERRLGKAFMRKAREALPISDDPLLTAYLESLGKELVAADQSAGGQFSFFLIDSPVVNAFAGPGGYIGVYSGLILASESEDELAAVMAHEIAHVTQRHLMRSFEDQGRLSLPTTALLVAAAILGAQVSSDAGMAAMASVQAAAIQRQINFTRDNEKEADRIGITTLAAAGRDPYAMAGFFERLSKASRVYENNAPEFLRTHPVNSNRIADALGRADEHGTRQRPDSLRFQLTRARLRESSYKRPEQSVAAFKASLKEGRYRDETAERYGYALALLRAGQLAEAKAEAQRLLTKEPSLPELIVLDAKIDLKQGNSARAIEGLKQATELSPSSWALRTAYAEALMEGGQPRRALDELKAVIRLRPGNVMIYELLTQAAIKSGDKAATYRYRAEKLYAEGDLEPAIKQLEFALRQRDIAYHDAAQIQVLLDAMKEELRDQKKHRDPLGLAAGGR
ncbi:MAG: M48 family metalloprotease [Bdellovibrio bacteriovorus]